MTELSVRRIRVLIVSENISLRMGGEASLPLYYARLFLARGAEVWLACHERVEAEVRSVFPSLESQMRFVRDTRLQMLACRIGKYLSPRLRELFIDQAIHFSTQARIRKIAIELARSGEIDVVLEPAPITPKGLSFMYGLGVPVVIGPLCGGMEFPPAFASMDSAITRIMILMGRKLSHVANRLVPGKIRADILLAANGWTVEALPAAHKGRVIRLFESGVDLELWKPLDSKCSRSDGSVRFVFSGRFVAWKGIEWLLPAFARAASREPRCRLDLIGGGEQEAQVRAAIKAHNLKDLVRLHGWLSRSDAAVVLQEADVFVMPSLRECGGTAILEAMALGKPVITTNWGGPADYVNASCGLLVDPSSKEAFVEGLAEAMVRLAASPELRKSLGEGGKQRVLQDNLDWHSKADRVLAILAELVAARVQVV